MLTLEFNIEKLQNVGVTYNDIKALVSGQLGPAPAAAAKPAAAGGAGGAAPPGGSGAGASGGGKRVSIRLNDFFPDDYTPPNPVAADIQNLLRLQYLSGLRNAGAGP